MYNGDIIRCQRQKYHNRLQWRDAATMGGSRNPENLDLVQGCRVTGVISLRSRLFSSICWFFFRLYNYFDGSHFLFTRHPSVFIHGSNWRLHSLLQSSVEAGFKIQKERQIASQLLYFFCWSPFLFRLRVCSFWKSIKSLQLADSLLVISAGLYCMTFLEVSSWEEWIDLAQCICHY